MLKLKNIQNMSILIYKIVTGGVCLNVNNLKTTGPILIKPAPTCYLKSQECYRVHIITLRHAVHFL